MDLRSPFPIGANRFLRSQPLAGQGGNWDGSHSGGHTDYLLHWFIVVTNFDFCFMLFLVVSCASAVSGETQAELKLKDHGEKLWLFCN